MANYDFGKDILESVLSRADELGIGSSDRETDAKRYIQASYISVVGEGFPWPWAKKEPPGVLTTSAEITTGTVAVTNNSATITFSSAPSASVAGRKFFVDADGVIYRISAHTGGSATATLDSAYLGTTNAAAAYHVFQDEYDLASDFLRPFGKRFLRDMHGRYALDLIGEDELSGRYAYPGASGTVPRYATMVAEKRIRLTPWPNEARRYEYAYVFHPGVLDFTGAGAGDTPIIQPAEDRIVLSFFALAHLLHDKNDDRAAGLLAAGEAKVKQMKLLGIKLNKPRIWMRSQYRVSAAR